MKTYSKEVFMVIHCNISFFHEDSLNLKYSMETHSNIILWGSTATQAFYGDIL